MSRTAERHVTRRAVTDQAVGGVDGLVERGAWQAGNGEPQHRRHDGIGEILGEAFDRRAGDAGLVERPGIAPDNMRYSGAARRDVAGLKRGCDVCHMPVQAALRDQRARDKRGDEYAERQAKQFALDNECDGPDNGENEQNGDNTRDTTTVRFRSILVEPAVKRADEAADPGHRMADRARQRLRIAQAEFDQHGE